MAEGWRLVVLFFNTFNNDLEEVVFTRTIIMRDLRHLKGGRSSSENHLYLFPECHFQAAMTSQGASSNSVGGICADGSTFFTEDSLQSC